MTARWRNPIRCCGDEVKCKKCGEAITSETNFSKWLRELEGDLSSRFKSTHNLDYIWLSFYENWFITIEEKRYGKKYNPNNVSDLSQIQSHGVIRQLLQIASGSKIDISFGTTKRHSEVEYRGHYVIIFEKTDPDDSEWIEINDQQCDILGLLILLTDGILAP